MFKRHDRIVRQRDMYIPSYSHTLPYFLTSLGDVCLATSKYLMY